MTEKKNVQTSLFGLGPEITQKANPNTYIRTNNTDSDMQNSPLSKVFDRLAGDLGISTKNPKLYMAFKKSHFARECDRKSE